MPLHRAVAGIFGLPGEISKHGGGLKTEGGFFYGSRIDEAAP